MTVNEVVAVAVVVPVVAAVAVWSARQIGRWFAKSLARSFADTVSEVVAPDLSRLGVRLGTSLDELRTANAQEHTEVQRRLRDLERLAAEIVVRLDGLEVAAGRRRRGDLPDAPNKETL